MKKYPIGIQSLEKIQFHNPPGKKRLTILLLYLRNKNCFD